jgi:hypothetical protein
VNETIFEIAGMAGVAFYLGSYAALQLGIVNGQGYTYAILNTIAASLVLISLASAFNLSSAIIQVSWIILGIIGIARHYYLTHRIRFNEEEQKLLDSALPDMDVIKARRFLDSGIWIDLEPNTVITEAGIPVPNLVYLMSGHAEVHVNQIKIAVIDDQKFIGEMTALSGDLATATVIAGERSRCLQIPAIPLRELLKKDTEMKRELEFCISSQVKKKLVEANEVLSQKPPVKQFS